MSTKPNLTSEQSQNLIELCNRLESGKIKQGHGRLALSDGRRCCLGVACDIVLEQTDKHWKLSPFSDDLVLSYPLYKDTSFCGLGERSVLPSEVMEKFGMPDMHGFELAIDGRIKKMSTHNDQFTSFKRIAKAIREQIL